MAVWIYAYGKNTKFPVSEKTNYLDIIKHISVDSLAILESICEVSPDSSSVRKHYEENRENTNAYFSAMSDTDYNTYLASINYPFIERDKLVDYFIKDGEDKQNEQRKQLRLACEKAKNGSLSGDWKIDHQNERSAFLSYHLHEPLIVDPVITIVLSNDLVRISGTFNIFSIYVRFQQGLSDASKEYYHHLFKSILKKFDSDFILYTHEWADQIADDELEPTVKMLFDYFNDSMSSSSIHNMEGFYYEKLQ